MVVPCNALDTLTREYSAERLAEKTDELRARLKSGAGEDDVLVEAFAVVREAARRVARTCDTSTCSSWAGELLHQGRIAEMATGEGKTLTAALPAYLNAFWEGRARRDGERLPGAPRRRVDGSGFNEAWA